MILRRVLTTFIVSGVSVFAALSCKSGKSDENADMSAAATSTTPGGAGDIGNQYDANPNYVDKVVDTPGEPLLSDGGIVPRYDESHIFDAGIDKRLDHRFDTAAVMAEVEKKAGLAAGTFSAAISTGFSPLEYGKALGKAGRPTEKFAAASVLAAMRRMRRFYYTVPFLNNARNAQPINVVLDRALGILRDPGTIPPGGPIVVPPRPGGPRPAPSVGLPRPPGASTTATAASPLAALAKFTSYPPSKLSDNPAADLQYQNLTHDGSAETDFKTPFDEFRMTWNTDGVGNDGANLGVMPPFWDEIQAAFYVEPPHRRHGCWTNALRSTGVDPVKMPVWEKQKSAAIHLSRFAIRDFCTGRVFLPDASGVVPVRGDLDASWYMVLIALPVQMAAYNLMWLDPAKRQFVTPPDAVRQDRGEAMGAVFTANPTDGVKIAAAVAALPAVRWAEAQRRKGFVNMWDYIMLHRLYAWDWTQQRAVLMAYFSDHKKSKRWNGTAVVAGETTKIKIDDEKDCAAWVPTRPGDLSPPKELCKDSKIMAKAASLGR